MANPKSAPASASRCCLRLLFLAGFTAAPAPAQIAFTDLEPRYGLAGSEAALFGSGFPETGPLVVRVGGADAVLLERTGQLIRFTIPPAATSGSVSITAGEAVYRFPAPFTITRFISAQIAAELQAVTANHTVGTLYADATGPGPVQTLEVAKGEPTLVAASAGETDPVLLAIVTEADVSVVLNAQSTASALVFLTPGIQTPDHEEAAARLAFLASRPETSALASAIENRLAAGLEYLEHPAVEASTIALAEAFFAEYQPSAPAVSPRVQGLRDDFVGPVPALATGYPRDLEAPGYEKLRKLVTSSSGAGVNDRGLPIIKIKVRSAPPSAGLEPLREYLEINPLDWMANLYELDPTDPALDSLEKAAAVQGDFSQVYARTVSTAVDRLHVKAKPAFRYLDLPELAAEQAMSMLSSFPTRKDHLEVPADRPGLYLIRAFSGARFPPQASLVNNLPEGRREASIMTALNLGLAAHDLLGFTAKETLGGDCFDKFLISIFTSTLQTVERETAQGTLSSEALRALFQNTAKSFLKDYVAKCLILNANRKGISGTTKVNLAGISLLGKLSSIGKVAERLNALGNVAGASATPQRIWTAQAVEDSLVVVGNPWQPRIRGFFPLEGYRGSILRIDGHHFAALTNENIVTFGVLSTDPTNPPVPARAEVLAAGSSSLIVRVPESANTGTIIVTVPGKGTTTTADLEAPFNTFLVLPDPVITGISPNPPVAGEIMQIHGSNFARITDHQDLIFSAGPVTQRGFGSRELLFVRAPNSTAPNAVKVRIHGRESNVLPFTPVLPAVIPAGSTIMVSTGLDNVAADDAISLREAILLANGGTAALGRELTSPPDPRPPQGVYETDFIFGDADPGAATKDYIIAHSSMVGMTVQAGSPLPALENFDDYDLALNISGGGGDGIRFVGSGIQFRADAVRNFAGHGLVLAGGAANNTLRDTQVEQCGGDGLRLEGNAAGNTALRIHVHGCLNGVHLTGTGVRFNRIEGWTTRGIARAELVGNQNFGALFAGGATMNELTMFAISSNGSGGVRITGEETTLNRIQGSGLYEGMVLDNSGPGIWINSPFNLVRELNVAGNHGPGILLEDPTCHDVRIDEVRVGYAFYEGQPRPNEGSGLQIRNGARQIVIGSASGDVSSAEAGIGSDLNYFAGNRDHGILVEGAGTRGIRINRTVVGAGPTAAGPSFAFPNGTNGIAVIGNAGSVEIGGPLHSSVVVANHTNGAGIYFARTTNNYVLGCKIGRDDIRDNRLGNRYGIHLTEGAFANVIGMRGLRQVTGQGSEARVFDSRNRFYGNLEAGILLESGGDPTRTIIPGEVPTGGNVIQNNIFGAHEVAGLENNIGILVRQNAQINRIGGTEPTEGNLFSGNSQAGILIDGAVISRSFLANRIIGNEFVRQGFRLSAPGDPLLAPPGGVGVALVNGSAGHVIGGHHPGEANEIRDNHVGVQLSQSRSNLVVGNLIHRNRAAGVVLLQAADNNVGPLNQVYRNATTVASLGGVVLKSATNNAVVGNWIGLRAGVTIASGEGNRHYGIGVLDSPQNLLGNLGGKNIIVGHTNGILISGAASTLNQVAHNHLGFSPVPGVFTTGNTQAGLLLTGGAHHNLVGGERPVPVGNGFVRSQAPNYIRVNAVDGVRVDGAGTVGNQLLYNSISDHNTGLGIQNLNGGNSELSPPTLVSHNGVEVVGAASVPDGSRVQFFSDNADEGRTFLGEELVAGGQVRFSIPVFAAANINATVTHAIQGDTSEFAPLIIHTNNGAGLLVQRVRQPPVTIPLPVPGPVGIAVAFRLRASGNPVLVSSVVFRTTGTANEAAPGTQVYLFRDENRNDLLDQPDLLLAGPRTFTTDNANAGMASLGRVIVPGTDQHWLLILAPAASAAPGATYSFEFPNEGFVTSRVLMTGETITESGEFPLLGDTLEVAAGQPPPTDLAIHRTLAGELALHWTGAGMLESAGTVTGPWTLIPNASSPFEVVPNQVQQFFRFQP